VNVVGVSLVRNEDRFIRRGLLNVASFCDRLLVADHQSSDRTPEILRELSRELDHLEVVRVSHSAQSHDLVAGLAGSDTWVLSVDGDELYDPEGLRTVRGRLETGEFADVFRIRPAGLHCDELAIHDRVAWGYLSPPGRPLLGLFNFAAIESWTNVRSERLHGGDVVFREGFDWNSWRHLGAELGWAQSPLRDLHVCFVPRSTQDESSARGGRPNLAETRRFRRGALGVLEQLVRRGSGRSPARHAEASDWKAEKYKRGERVRVDASAFFGAE
jgi:glycosyltransferase involved in cell wall biosynthesis